jgi:hypothetical protein
MDTQFSGRTQWFQLTAAPVKLAANNVDLAQPQLNLTIGRLTFGQALIRFITKRKER